MQLATKEFGEVKYEIIRSSQLLSPLLTKEQQNEARLERKFEEIINAAKASKSIGRMFSDGTTDGTLATPDSTFSTLDKNSNFGMVFFMNSKIYSQKGHLRFLWNLPMLLKTSVIEQ